MRHFSFLLASLVFGVTAWAQAPQVTQVTANQFGSFVRIAYDLSGPADTPIAVSFAASNDGGALFSLPLTEVHGDAGTNLSPGAGKVAIWDAGTDLPDSINGDVRIWVKTWIPNAARVTLADTGFVFVYADGHDTGGTLRETQLPGFYVTPCRISQSLVAPAVPQALIDSYPDFAFEVFQDDIAGETWSEVQARTPWNDRATRNCTWESGWRVAAYYWPSDDEAATGPNVETRPWRLSDALAVSPPFALDTTTALRDLDGDGLAEDKTDHDQDGILDVYQDYDGDGVADAFEDANQDDIADAYDAAGAGEAALGGFGDSSSNALPAFFASRYPITSSTHPRGDRVYFDGNFAGTINPYQPGAAGYRWRISSEETVTLDNTDGILSGIGPHVLTADPGDGIHYLHVAAVDGSGAPLPGSARRFVFNASLHAPTISSETHPEPYNSSLGRVFAARMQVNYGPKQWRTETGDTREGHATLAFKGALWILQPDGSVWRSRDGFQWETETVAAPWASAQFLSATVFQNQLWVYGSSTKVTGEGLQATGTLWTSSNGRHWVQRPAAPWTNREEPALVVFRDALYVFGGVAYAPLSGPVTTSAVWRTADGATWSKVANDVAWGVRNAPTVCTFGDSLWLDAYPENPLVDAGDAAPWRSWDGVHWVAAAPVPEAAPSEELLPSEGDWYDWDNAYWRYFAHPWTAQLTPFRETLWYAGAVPAGDSLPANTGDIWWYNRDHEFERAVEHFEAPDAGAANGISFRGRIHLIGTKTALHSEYGDRWYGSGLQSREGSLTIFQDTLWSGGAYPPQLIAAGYLNSRLLTFNNEIFRLGYRATNSATDLPRILRSTNGRDWTVVSYLSPWHYRYNFGAVVHDGAMWVLGGASDVTLLDAENWFHAYEDRVYNDVWRSTDGQDWTQVSGNSPWEPRQPTSVAAYDGAIWMLGGTGLNDERYADLWHSTDGVTWEQDTIGLPAKTLHTGTLVAHQDSLFLISSDGEETPQPVRRLGHAYTPSDSLRGIRYVVDSSPDTVPNAQSPLTPQTYLVEDPMPPGDYWLHLVAVDSLGNVSTPVHRAFTIKPTAAPTLSPGLTPGQTAFPGNQLSATIISAELPQTAGPTYYGLNTVPGGSADVEAPEGRFPFPCLAVGTYWLVAQSSDLYGFRSPPAEQEITILPRETLPAPRIGFPYGNGSDERNWHLPGSIPIRIWPDPLSLNDTVYVVDQRYGLPTDYSGAAVAPTGEFSLSNAIPGRYYVHAQSYDNCDEPSHEAVRSFHARKRFAPIIKMDPTATLDTVVLLWEAENADGLQYRYVIDSEPNTEPTLASDSTMETGMSFEVPDGHWERFVHVSIEYGPGLLSDAGHYQLVGDDDNYIGIRAPQRETYYDSSVTYSIAAPTLHFLEILQAQVSALPSMEGVTVLPTSLVLLGQEASVRLTRQSEGPIALVLPQGSVSGLDRAVSPCTTRYIDMTRPELLIDTAVFASETGPNLHFTITAPEAEDLYLPARVFELFASPDIEVNATPVVQFENGLWEVTYANVDSAMQSFRLRVSSQDWDAGGRCTGYDRADNCIESFYSPWLDAGETPPEITVTEPASLFLGPGNHDYLLALSEPVNVPPDVSAVQLESDPPGSITATMAMTTTGLTTYKVTLSNLTGEGELRLVLPEGYVMDPAGMPSAEVASAWRTIDNTKPVIHMGTAVPPAFLGGDISFPFSVSGTGRISIPQLSVVKTGQVSARTKLIRLNAVGDTQFFEGVITAPTGVGTVTLRVNGNNVVDYAGNKADTVTSGEIFDVNQYNVVIEAFGSGTTTPAPGGYAYAPGTALQIAAVPGEGDFFKFWLVNGSVDTSPVLNLTLQGDYKLEAYFTDSSTHQLDQNGDHRIELRELLRAIQFFNAGGLHCDEVNGGSEDGFLVGPGDQACPPHDLDYQVQDWLISMSELLRAIQIYNSPGYEACEDSEDGFCVLFK